MNPVLMSENYPAGATLDFFAYNSVGNVWNGSAYVTPPAGGTSPAAYRIAAAEGPTGRYTATAPAGAVAYDLRLQASTWAASTVVAADYLPAAVRETVVESRPVTVIIDN